MGGTGVIWVAVLVVREDVEFRSSRTRLRHRFRGFLCALARSVVVMVPIGRHERWNRVREVGAARNRSESCERLATTGHYPRRYLTARSLLAPRIGPTG